MEDGGALGQPAKIYWANNTPIWINSGHTSMETWTNTAANPPLDSPSNSRTGMQSKAGQTYLLYIRGGGEAMEHDE
jgi:hypothetical protein